MPTSPLWTFVASSRVNITFTLIGVHNKEQGQIKPEYNGKLQIFTQYVRMLKFTENKCRRFLDLSNILPAVCQTLHTGITQSSREGF